MDEVMLWHFFQGPEHRKNQLSIKCDVSDRACQCQSHRFQNTKELECFRFGLLFCQFDQFSLQVVLSLRNSIAKVNWLTNWENRALLEWQKI